MIDYIVLYFTSLFNSCLKFVDIIYVLSAVFLLATIVTVIIYLVKGRY